MSDLTVLRDPQSSMAHVMQAITALEDASDPPLLRAGVSANITTDLLGTYLRRHALLAGGRAVVEQGDFDSHLAGRNIAIVMAGASARRPNHHRQRGRPEGRSVASRHALQRSAPHRPIQSDPMRAPPLREIRVPPGTVPKSRGGSPACACARPGRNRA